MLKKKLNEFSFLDTLPVDEEGNMVPSNKIKNYNDCMKKCESFKTETYKDKCIAVCDKSYKYMER